MGKFKKDQKVVALTFEGLTPCTIVRVGWIFITVQVEETKHLNSITKGKIVPLEEDKYYLLEECINEEGNFEIGDVFGIIDSSNLESVKKEFANNGEFEKKDGQYYTRLKTGSELLKQYFN
ncbi:hypothetical protein JFT95_12695 [Bacillus sp. TH17]|uniref:hypothetical protein n=1 Tax=Bacillus sp. TH17 TaxID=2796383 RepID=UPI0019113E13|nr:hypothetical protein [Bacillus sp. TH17]MBK5488322.1 hypothetical protein [Bacillus sp. TH17]